MPRRDDDPRVKAIAERREAQDKANAESMRRMEDSTPTPTQEEADLAKVGALDTFADDGSGPDRTVTRAAAPVDDGAPYRTRAVAPGRKPARRVAKVGKR